MGQAKREKIKKHLQRKKGFELPYWMFYVFGILAIVAITYGGIQHFRVWRYAQILRRSKALISDLDSRVQSARLEGMQEVAKKQHTLNRAEMSAINNKLRLQVRRQKDLKEKINGLKPSDLLREFQREGF